MGPIDYTIGGNLPSPTQSFLQGIQVVDALKAREMAQQAQIDAQKAAEQKQAYQSQFMQKIMSGTVQPSDYEGLKMLDPANYKAWEGSIQQLGTAKKEAAISNMSPVYYGLSLGTDSGIATAKEKLQTQLTAAENSGDKQTADRVQGILASLETPEGRAQVMATAGATLNAIDPEAFKKLHENLMAVKGSDTLLAQKRAELAKATSEADKSAIEAKYAEQEKIAELKNKAAQLGLTRAQTNSALASASKLTTEGKLLTLDFQAALQGLPLPSKNDGKATTVGAATEDERKAAGWLAQATNAYSNMLKSMYGAGGKKTGAESPGLLEAVAIEPLKNIVRGPERQQFVQASSSLSEALLRAATGAGVNRDEAQQKITELTPVYSDSEEVRKQKLEAIPMYLKSLQDRAGRAAPKDYQQPTSPAPSSGNLNIRVNF